MSWRTAAARSIQAQSDCLTDTLAVAASAEFDLPADEVRAVIARLAQPTVDQLIADLVAGKQPSGERPCSPT